MKFTVYGSAGVTLFAEIEASTAREALEKAEDLGAPTATNSPYICDPEGWETDGDLSDPKNFEVQDKDGSVLASSAQLPHWDPATITNANNETPVIVKAQPIFELSLPKPLVAALIKSSEHHYDGLCKAQSQQGGFLFGARNALLFRDPADITISDRDASLLLKICENLSFHERDDYDRIWQFANTLRRAFEEGQRLSTPAETRL